MSCQGTLTPHPHVLEATDIDPLLDSECHSCTLISPSSPSGQKPAQKANERNCINLHSLFFWVPSSELCIAKCFFLKRSWPFLAKSRAHDIATRRLSWAGEKRTDGFSLRFYLSFWLLFILICLTVQGNRDLLTGYLENSVLCTTNWRKKAPDSSLHCSQAKAM